MGLPGAQPPRPGALPPADRLWYAAYGSNTHLTRLARYLAHCRDRTPPVCSRALELPGAVYFATESAVWGGGRAFYDPAADGRAFFRAHLITAGQFADVAAQEMYRAPGADLDLTAVLAHGRATLGEGRYETLVRAGTLDALPVLTFTAPWRAADVDPLPPSAAYARHIALGLLEAGAWSAAEVAAYVAGRPGAAGHWSPEAVAEPLARPEP
ncbi:histone deacetylase [Streptomyces sp. NPDC050504]|uniref:histone deacetylase n=1 Tax=Streptomyces sp. NPDC050504 TaxID=3365618 RepID=UPI0037A21A8D